MGRNLDDVIGKMSAERQAKIAALSQKKIEDMIAHAATLTDFRKAVGKTQAEVAKELGINQNAVSQLETRSDTYVSTLRRFLKSLGMTLELSVIDKNGVRIDLPNFRPWDTGSSANNVEESAVAAHSPQRKSVATASAARKSPVRTKAAKNAVTANSSTTRRAAKS